MSTSPVTLRLSEPAEAISIVPYLLGFHPTNSIVVLALRQTRLLTGARLDLPTDPQDREAYTEAIHHLAGILSANTIDAAMLIGYGPTDPVASVMDIATAVLTATDIGVRAALRVDDGRWWNLTCTDPTCCPLEGVAFDQSASVAATTATAAGLVALPNRDAVAEQLAPVTGPARQAFAAATEAAVTRMLQIADLAAPDNRQHDSDAWLTTPLGHAVTIAARELVTEAMDTYRRGHVLHDHPAATLTVALGMPAARDTAIRRSTGDDWQIRMWTDLLRRAEPEFTPGPAVLLAVVALQSGNGTLAGCAARRALAADPDNRVAQQLLCLIRAGIDPRTMAALIAAI